MPLSFLKRLLERKRRGTNEASLLGTSYVAVPKEVPSVKTPPQSPDLRTVAKRRSLLAFVDLKDPFVPSEIAGEELPGPILSILSAKPFDAVFLFHTPQTRSNAVATEAEVARRHPLTTHRKRLELPVQNPKDYSSLMHCLCEHLLQHFDEFEEDEMYLCVSSGTAEMRAAAWLLPPTLGRSLLTMPTAAVMGLTGIVQATLLQVGTPANPLFGKVNVKELRVGTAEWQAIQDLLTTPTAAVKGSRANIAFAGKGKKPESAIPPEKSKSAQEIFEKEFAERMRMWVGEARTAAVLPKLSSLVKAGLYEAIRLHLSVQWEDLNRLGLVRSLGHRQRESLGAVVGSSASNTSSSMRAGSMRDETSPEDHPSLTRDLPSSTRKAADVAEESKSTPQRFGAPPQTKRHVRDPAAEKAPPEQAPLNETPVEVLLDKIVKTAQDKKGAKEDVAEEVDELSDTGLQYLGRDNREFHGEARRFHTAPSLTQGIQIEPVSFAVPGLDDALLELGIHIGSAVLRHAAEQAGIAADSNLPVLLLGETGTGKEQFAHLIHRLSSRFGKAMVAVNCAAIPAPLAESYLFGHVKGAFSDATSDKAGIFESADCSTLFLDEIAELTLEVQAKLLRVIPDGVHDGVIQRLGSTSAKKVDVRIIAASNRDLTKEVSVGRFREDLYFRLEGVTIKLPALRDRQSEIPELALALLRQINLRRREPRQLTIEALKRLECYSWPGNVRQLLNVLQRSVLYSRSDTIDAGDLLFSDNGPTTDFSPALPKFGEGFSIEKFLAELRKQLFQLALAKSNGNQAQAAALLGVSKQAVNKFVADQSGNGS